MLANTLSVGYDCFIFLKKDNAFWSQNKIPQGISIKSVKSSFIGFDPEKNIEEKPWV